MPERSDYVYHSGDPIAYFERQNYTEWQYDSLSSGYAVDNTGATSKEGYTEINTVSQILFDNQGAMYKITESSGTVLEKFVNGSLEWTYGDAQTTGVIDENSGLIYTTTPDELVAININTGDENWRINLPNIGELYPPLLIDTVIYIAVDNEFHAVDIESKSVIWSHTSTDRYRGKPTHYNNTIFMSENNTNNMYALDPTDGSEIWKYTNDVFGSIATPVWDGIVYTSTSNGITALNTSDGSQIWQSGNTFFSGGFAVSPDGVFGMDYNGDMWAFDPKDGSTIWTRNLQSGQSQSPPAIVDGLVHQPSGSSYVVMNIRNGETQFTYSVDDLVTLPPTPHEGTMYAPPGQPV